jgi:quercetin dioxygenase-like cupin family protein
MLSSKKLQVGDIDGLIYDFSEAGDQIDKHIHGKQDAHIIIVAKGSVKVYSHDWETIAQAGDILNMAEEQPHAVVSLEPNTKIINILKTLNGYHNERNFVG